MIDAAEGFGGLAGAVKGEGLQNPGAEIVRVRGGFGGGEADGFRVGVVGESGDEGIAWGRGWGLGKRSGG